MTFSTAPLSLISQFLFPLIWDVYFITYPFKTKGLHKLLTPATTVHARLVSFTVAIRTSTIFVSMLDLTCSITMRTLLFPSSVTNATCFPFCHFNHLLSWRYFWIRDRHLFFETRDSGVLPTLYIWFPFILFRTQNCGLTYIYPFRWCLTCSELVEPIYGLIRVAQLSLGNIDQRL